jgi:hypothetical protein
VRETEEGWRLHSIHYGEPWPVRSELDAWCYRSRYVSASNSITHDRHAAPIKGCFCGIYGAKELEQVRQYVVASHSGYAAVGDYAHRVVGHVNLWGRVVECSQGFRASRAYPARLWLPTRRPDGKTFDVERAALGLLDYGVPTELLDAGTRYEIINQLRYARRAAA